MEKGGSCEPWGAPGRGGTRSAEVWRVSGSEEAGSLNPEFYLESRAAERSRNWPGYGTVPAVLVSQGDIIETWSQFTVVIPAHSLCPILYLVRYRAQRRAVLCCRVPWASSYPGLGVQVRWLGVAGRLYFTVRPAAPGLPWTAPLQGLKARCVCLCFINPSHCNDS